MDALDRLAPAGRDLLTRVDGVLAARGAPADHPIWPLLRAVGALSCDVLRFASALRPAPLATAGSAVRQLLRGYEYPRAISPQWTGPAARAFVDHAAALEAQVTGTLGRIAAVAEYADVVAAWADDTRQALARTLADALGSAQAATLVAGQAGELDEDVAAVAADIGAAVLRVARAALASGEILAAEWAPRLAPDPPAAPASLPGDLGVVQAELFVDRDHYS